MKREYVPQDNISTLAGAEKLIYATDEDGHYNSISSTGWSIEEEVTRQALLELERLADEAYQEVVSGKASPLYYYMFAKRMNIQILAQSTGLFQWRIKRHFKPEIFSKLNDDFLERYSDVLGLTVDEIKHLPEIENND